MKFLLKVVILFYVKFIDKFARHETTNSKVELVGQIDPVWDHFHHRDLYIWQGEKKTNSYEKLPLINYKCITNYEQNQ